MGLDTTIKKLTATAFNVVKDILINASYLEIDVNNSRYDVEKGRTIFYGKEHENLKFLFEEYDQKEIDGENINSEDRKISIPSLSLKRSDDSLIIPKVKDVIKINSDLTEWSIVNFKTDPIEALWILQARKVPDL